MPSAVATRTDIGLADGPDKVRFKVAVSPSSTSATLKAKVGGSSLSTISTSNTPLGAEEELTKSALTALAATTWKVSFSSSMASSTIPTMMVLLFSPGKNVTVWSTARKSSSAAAVPAEVLRSIVIVLPEAVLRAKVTAKSSFSSTLLAPVRLISGASSLSAMVMLAELSLKVPMLKLESSTVKLSSFSSKASSSVLTLMVFSNSPDAKVRLPEIWL